MNIHMTELRRFFKDSLFDCGRCAISMCTLPYDITIDGIPVYVKFVHYKTLNYINIVLYNINIVKYPDDDDDVFNDDYNLLMDSYLVKTTPDIIETIEMVISSLHKLMHGIRFDTYYGKFISDNSCNQRILGSEIVELFKDCPQIETPVLHRHEKCCVCLEETLTKTHCGHSICIRCVISMESTRIVPEENCDERLTEYELWCPICRRELMF
jgi:hypothetical protein